MWTPPRRPSTLVAPILDVTGMYTRAHTVGKATLVDEHPGTIPLLIRHKAELGVHGVVLRLERDTTGTLWATCHVDDHAGCLVRSGDYTELSPALLGDGHNWAGDDGVDYTELADATIVEVSLVEASRFEDRPGPRHADRRDLEPQRDRLRLARQPPPVLRARTRRPPPSAHLDGAGHRPGAGPHRRSRSQAPG